MKKLPLRKIPGPRSAEFLATSIKVEPLCSADQTPFVWDHGQGVRIWDVDGNEYIDFTSGVLVTNVGHSHPHYVKAIQDQAARLMNCYSFFTAERITASERMVKTLPSNLDRIFMLSTGAEATEAALRVARRYTKKQEVLSFYGAFHGRTYGAMSVSGSISTRREFGAPVPGNITAPYGYCYRCVYGKTYPECEFHCLKSLDRIIASTSSGDLGTVIVEPYQGSAGFIFPPDGWLKALEKWANERELIFIVDEVQSSFGRTGKLYAIEWEDIRPNMLCLGKGMGSGIPASGLAAESRIFEAMHSGELASTWGGNPIASTATIAVLDIMENEKLPENARKVGEYMRPMLLDLQRKHPCIGDVRGKGLVQGLEIVKSATDNTPAPELTRKIVLAAAERGLILGKVGLYGNVIRLAPPLVIQQEEIDLAIDILDAAIAKALE